MDNQQVRFILESYQASRSTPPDPRVREALALMRANEELQDWFAADQALDAVLRQKLHEVPVPSDLREKLLATSPEVVVPPTFSWRPSLALAAAIVLLLGLLWWNSREGKEPRFHQYRLQMVETLYQPLNFEFKSDNPSDLEAWVRENTALGPIKIPPALAALPALGCRTFNYDGRTAVLLCFQTSPQTAVHLFVLSARDLDHELTLVAQSATVGAFQTAAWAEGDLVYVLAGSGDAEALKSFLPSAVAITATSASLVISSESGIFVRVHAPEWRRCRTCPTDRRRA